MSRDEALDFAISRGYNIVHTDLTATRSISVQHGDKCTIGIDRNLTETEEKEAVMHEIGHCETGTFYSPDADAITKAKCEHKATRWAYERLVPYNELLSLYHSYVFNRDTSMELWDLAEHFDVSCETMAKVLRSFYDRKGIYIY